MSNESVFRQAILNGAFTYTARPDPMPGDLRISWGMAILVLALFFSRAKKSNFQKLQFLAHSVRIPEGREEVRGLLSGQYRPADVSVRVEPSLNRAVALAHALKVVKIDKGISISLTEQGVKLGEAILKERDVLNEEKQFLGEVAPRMTDALMKRVWRLEDLL
ncbi:hypothetical protein ACM41_00040 [Bradyrhizobium sp. CCBAU 21362]|uniref:hypothetical protein n=1 Tax=Bradyrhizobium sp. CCBAU 21362 TaxID=1325082 RepID=UPI0023064000|nr:hypothetical protein [Bradyrhizobium sp. CCBAU 21362]MDA9534738.1 hypothetical protein [Bradyrhizobium sp. CCBAU 21362]